MPNDDILWIINTADQKTCISMKDLHVINDFSGSCLTLPRVFSPHCLNLETALLLLESDLQQSSLDQLLEQNVLHLWSNTIC